MTEVTCKRALPDRVIETKMGVCTWLRVRIIRSAARSGR
jgi:hypothetical protein